MLGLGSSFSESRGAEGICKALSNEALCKNPGKHGLINHVYLFVFGKCVCVLGPSWLRSRVRRGRAALARGRAALAQGPVIVDD